MLIVHLLSLLLTIIDMNIGNDTHANIMAFSFMHLLCDVVARKSAVCASCPIISHQSYLIRSKAMSYNVSCTWCVY